MTEFEQEYLSLCKQEAERNLAWSDKTLRMIAVEVGAKMRSPTTTTSSIQRANVLDNAKWAYEQATGKAW